MDEEKDMGVKGEQAAEASSSQTVPGGELEVAATEAATDSVTGEGSPPQAAIPPGGGAMGPGKAKGGGFKGFFTQHKVLAGAVVGIMAALLAVGLFIAGYYAGKPDGRQTREPLSRQTQPYSPGPQQQPDVRSAPSPGQGGATEGLPGILEESREEIESEIAKQLGISVDDLQDEVESGKSIADLAVEKGVTVEALTSVVAAKISEIADRLEVDGDIASKQAEEIKSNADKLASRFIEIGRRRPPMPST